MIRLANVLLINGDVSETEALQARMSHNGYHAVCAGDLAQALAHVRMEHLDLVIIARISEAPIAFAHALQACPEFADIPIVIATDAVTPDLAEAAVAAGLDDVVSLDCGDVELFARLRPLVRLATMHAEYDQRVEIASGLSGLAKPAAVSAAADADAAILVIGPDDGGLAAALQGLGEIVSSVNLYDAETLLERRNFDAAIVCAKGDPAPFLAFSSQVRNNPRLFNLPMVMAPDGAKIAEEAYRHGISRVMAPPLDQRIFRAVVTTLVRRQQLRWSIRTALADCLKGASLDPMTGVYSRAFLDKYLEARLAIAQTHQRHLAVVFFAIPNVDGVRDHFGDDAAEHLTLQLGQWITGLLRAEDLTAVYGKNEFCVVLPDTPLVEAEVVMHRIAGVLAYTDFAVREVYQPVKVWVQVGCTNAKADDTLNDLLARARAKLD